MHILIHRRYIDNEHGGQTHLAEKGDGSGVLLLHQTPRSWDEFHEVLDILGDNFHAIAMDLPGMGASSKWNKNASIEDYASAAAQVIESLESGPVDVIGHHTGGVVAIELASAYPQLVKSLVLSSTPYIDEQVRIQRASKTPIDTVIPTADGSYLVDLWQQRQPYYPEGFKYLQRYISSALLQKDPSEGHQAVSRYKMEDSVNKVQCPVLIIEHQQDPFTVNHTAAIRRAFPNSELECIPEGGVALEATAKEFSHIVQKWLERPE